MSILSKKNRFVKRFLYFLQNLCLLNFANTIYSVFYIPIHICNIFNIIKIMFKILCDHHTPTFISAKI